MLSLSCNKERERESLERTVRMNLVILSLTSTGEFVENREEESQIFFFKVESFLYNFLFCSKSFQPPKKSDTKRIEHYQTNLYIPG